MENPKPNMTRFPTLYKKTATGAIQEWNIFVLENTIYTDFGQIDGATQTASDVISKGKNIGKVNETTPAEQALAEAQAKWEKQVKKGYVEDLDQARQGSDNLESVKPMLAQPFDKHSHKIKYPCFLQKKYDGIRCIAIIDDGKCTLWSRSRKPITSVPHIVAELESRFAGMSLITDGELYNHNFKYNFEHIVHIVRQQKEPDPNHKDVEYHVYDLVSDAPFKDRYRDLQALLHGHSEFLKPADTLLVDSETELLEFTKTFIGQGYEGGIARNADSPYAGKRSYDLQKIKTFEDAEFLIVGVNEGRGKLKGHAATFTCVTEAGDKFEAKLKGELSKLKEYWENPEPVLGTFLTVQFQGYTNKNNVPRFPVGLRIRNLDL